VVEPREPEEPEQVDADAPGGDGAPGEGGPISPGFREALDELEAWLEHEPDDALAEHALLPATRWILSDVPGLDLERYTEEAKTFVLATPIWDRALIRYRNDVTYWMSQRLLMNEADEPEPERARELLAAARAVIAERADLLDGEGFPRIARSFRALLDETAGGEPPADLVWRALGLRIAEPFLENAADPVPLVTPSASPPPSEPPEPASE
jgi:hypothetical protein